MTAYHIVADNTEHWIADGVFTDIPLDGAQTLRGVHAIAGLVDAHSHATLDLSDNGKEQGTADVVRANMRDYAAAGVTAIRDAGGVSMAAVEARDPRIVAAGRLLAPHGRYFPEWTLAADPPALQEAAMAQVAAGATWVKVINDWFSPETGLVEQH